MSNKHLCEHKVITGFVLISFTYHHTGLDNPATAGSYELYAHVLFTNISLDLQEQPKHKKTTKFDYVRFDSYFFVNVKFKSTLA